MKFIIFKKWITLAIVCVIAFCVILVFADLSATRLPKPYKRTLTVMFNIHRDILVYAAEHGYPPKTLDDVPNLQGYRNKLVDAWNRKIEYHLIDDNIVELTSVGKDGLSGGKDENCDVVRRFALRDQEGQWNDPLCDWLPESVSDNQDTNKNSNSDISDKK